MTGHGGQHGTLKVGDQVTILPPWDDDPILIAMQHYVRVAAVVEGVGYMVDLPAASSPRFGPFAENRLLAGWRDERGRWRLG